MMAYCYNIERPNVDVYKDNRRQEIHNIDAEPPIYNNKISKGCKIKRDKYLCWRIANL